MENTTFKCDFCDRHFNNILGKKKHEYFCKCNPDYANKLDALAYNAKRVSEGIKNAYQRYREINPYKYQIKSFVCNCAKCNKEYTIETTLEKFDNGLYRKNCSASCANGHSHSKEQKTNISEGLKKYNESKHTKLIDGVNYFYNEDGDICTYSTCVDCGLKFVIEQPDKMIGTYKFIFKLRKYCLNCWFKHSKFLVGLYNGIRCDSSWELAFLVYHLDNGIDIKRCDTPLEYIYDGSVHKYFPDFEVNGVLYEIKGYENDKAKAKKKLHPEVIILKYEDVLPYIRYVQDKYGNNYCETLYEKHL